MPRPFPVPNAQCQMPISRVIILCPGPSLAEFLRAQEKGSGSRDQGSDPIPDARSPVPGTAVIGVNRAAEVFPCDWWCAADHETIGTMRPVPTPGGGSPRLCTCQQAIVLADRKWPDDERVQGLIHPANVRTFERLGAETDCPLEHGWKSLSMLAAMVLAENLIRKASGIRQQAIGGGDQADACCPVPGASIHLYGCDWAGIEDFDGTVPPGAEVGRSDYRWKNERAHFERVAGWLASKSIAVERKTLTTEARRHREGLEAWGLGPEAQDPGPRTQAHPHPELGTRHPPQAVPA